MKRIAVFCTHPIQYFAPLWRTLASSPGVSIHVYYASDHSVRGAIDEKFGVSVKWDTPILEGYPHTFMTQPSWLEKRVPFFRHDRRDVDEILSKKSFDAVLLLAYDRWLHWRVLWAAKKSGIPVMLRGDNLDGTKPKRSIFKAVVRRNILRHLYKNIRAFLSIGTYTHRHYVEHGVSEDRIFSSGHCVDTYFFEKQRDKFLPLRDLIRKDLGFGVDDFVFMFSGKMIEKKNPLLIADAFKRLSIPKSVKFLAVGDGKMKSELEQKVRETLGDGAVFTGFVNQSGLGKYYSASDAFILPSAWGETWGLVVNEAMIFGLPVIVSDTVGCGRDLVIPGKTGYIFPSGNAVALSQAMKELVEHPSRAKDMGTAGSLLIKNFSVEQAVSGILQAFESISEQNA
jgi:glycosyltransferase involved in cell wall biosynthesis